MAGLLTVVALGLYSGFHATIMNNYVWEADAWLRGYPYLPHFPGDYIDAIPYHGRAYVYEAPFPAVLLLPFVAVWGFRRTRRRWRSASQGSALQRPGWSRGASACRRAGLRCSPRSCCSAPATRTARRTATYGSSRSRVRSRSRCSPSPNVSAVASLGGSPCGRSAPRFAVIRWSSRFRPTRSPCGRRFASSRCGSRTSRRSAPCSQYLRRGTTTCAGERSRTSVSRSSTASWTSGEPIRRRRSRSRTSACSCTSTFCSRPRS